MAMPQKEKKVLASLNQVQILFYSPRRGLQFSFRLTTFFLKIELVPPITCILVFLRNQGAIKSRTWGLAAYQKDSHPLMGAGTLQLSPNLRKYMRLSTRQPSLATRVESPKCSSWARDT